MDAKLTLKSDAYLIISIWAFLFVMIQGNILFIPEIRWAFHRNDLVVAHAHIAIGVGIFFMALSTLSYFYKLPQKFANFWLLVMGVIFFSLTIAGFSEAGYLNLDIVPMLQIRFVGGILAVGGLFYFIVREIKQPKIDTLTLYHLNGFASDGLGALILFLFAPLLFEFLGFKFTPYYYLIFGFMSFVGILHLIGAYKDAHLFAWLTSTARLITGTIFLSLFYIHTVDTLGLLVGFYDIAYALIYMLLRNRL